MMFRSSGFRGGGKGRRIPPPPRIPPADPKGPPFVLFLGTEKESPKFQKIACDAENLVKLASL